MSCGDKCKCDCCKKKSARAKKAKAKPKAVPVPRHRMVNINVAPPIPFKQGLVSTDTTGLVKKFKEMSTQTTQPKTVATQTEKILKEEVLKKPERYVRRPVTITNEIKEQVVEPPSRYSKHMAEMNPPPRKRAMLYPEPSVTYHEPNKSKKSEMKDDPKKHSALLQRMLESEQGSFGMSSSGKSAFNPEREARKERKDK